MPLVAGGTSKNSESFIVSTPFVRPAYSGRYRLRDTKVPESACRLGFIEKLAHSLGKIKSFAKSDSGTMFTIVADIAV